MIVLRYSTECTVFPGLNRKKYWILSKASSAFIEMTMCCLSFRLFIYYIYQFTCVEPSLYLLDGAYLIIIVNELFNVFLNLVWRYFIGIFICVHKGNHCVILLQGSCKSINRIIDASSFSILGKLRSFGTNSSLRIWQNSEQKPSGLQCILVGK